MNDDPVENSGDYSRTEPLRLTVPDASYGRRLDQILAEMLPQHSRNRLQGWVRDACVLVDGKPETEPKRKMMGGEKLLVSEPTDIRNQPELPEDIPLDVVFEDETLLVINKPAGLVVHPGSGNWSGTLMNALLHHVPGIEAVPRAGIVHRLDKDTSGLLVVAKTLEAQTDLVRQLQARTVRRIYLALAAGAMKHEGTVNEPIGRHPSQRIKMAIVPENRGGKPAITNIRILELFPLHDVCRVFAGNWADAPDPRAHGGHSSPAGRRSGLWQTQSEAARVSKAGPACNAPWTRASVDRTKNAVGSADAGGYA